MNIHGSNWVDPIGLQLNRMKKLAREEWSTNLQQLISDIAPPLGDHSHLASQKTISWNACSRVRDLANGNRLSFPITTKHWLPLLETYLRLPSLEDSWTRLLDCWRMERAKLMIWDSSFVDFNGIAELVLECPYDAGNSDQQSSWESPEMSLWRKTHEVVQVSHINGSALSATQLSKIVDKIGDPPDLVIDKTIDDFYFEHFGWSYYDNTQNNLVRKTYCCTPQDL